MQDTVAALAEQACALAPTDKARLVDLLLDSFLQQNYPPPRAAPAGETEQAAPSQAPASNAPAVRATDGRGAVLPAEYVGATASEESTSTVDVVAPLPVVAATRPAASLRQHHAPLQVTIWPTRELGVRARWYDELCILTEGPAPGTMKRAELQLDLLDLGFSLLEEDMSCRLATTLSFGTIERCLDQLTDVIESNRLLCHRIAILVRGQVERMRSPYRVRGFLDWLRAQQIPVGYRLAAPRISMEMKAIDFVQPDFARVKAPPSRRLEFWQDSRLEARAAGLDVDWVVVAGLDDDEQKRLATAAGFRLGQGSAVKRCHGPATRRTDTSLDSGERNVGTDTLTPAARRRHRMHEAPA